MRLLVEVESKNRILSYHMETSRAFEASLRDQISLLEGQLGGTGAEFLYVAQLPTDDLSANAAIHVSALRISKVSLASTFK